ncbi:ZYRO0G18810p [Zygosaccharomyces rouxii]|uniref:ZYRO0G18810p n=1 Tax=Zygosaccharomyces rouxii (strain ATCC 2623 / CBS 732 / NBRC 1130 / NCYC 568 / NRRL Y-229) TaxID=559307 RepID=C5E181_ZYGRC|nr:uncharacterized protein ZYRO0G18810g [Zygosaccharomyces rouxii]KAH9202858.1 pheromone A receptor-domain-containing protein [Zygosaccharomyces rouxii]CAR29865.1 ZYRO0G18810p [Zygosaccharomyces rouxii]
MSYQSNIIGLSLVAILLLLPPLAWHTHSRNIPAVLLILWLFTMDLTSLVGASIWSEEDFMNRWNGKGWCDIVVKLQVGANVGMPCAVTNIVYNLHTVLRANTVLPELNSWSKICCDLTISLATPVIIMALSYIVQVARFGIVRFNGCQNVLSPTWLTTVLYTMWGLIWSTAGMVYAFLVLYVFHRKRKDVRDILHCTNSRLNLARFSRLLILCFLTILVMFPLSVFGVAEDIKSFKGKYNWNETHSPVYWNTIPKYDEGKSIFSVWLYILMSYLVFIIFGLGTDALQMYANILRTMKLGFIVDKLQNANRRSKNSQIARVLGKIAPGIKSSDSNSSCYNDYSDSTLEKNENGSYQTSSPTSQSKFFVDYDIPSENNSKAFQARKKRLGIFARSRAESKNSDNDGEAPKNKFLPYLSERCLGNDYDSLNTASQLTSISSPANAVEPKPGFELEAELTNDPQSAVYYVPGSNRNTVQQLIPHDGSFDDLTESLESSKGEISFHYKMEKK